MEQYIVFGLNCVRTKVGLQNIEIDSEDIVLLEIVAWFLNKELKGLGI